jgi:hypothetical protein
MTTAAPPLLRIDQFTDDPAKLADEIEQALHAYGLHQPRRLFQSLNFFEGELALIVGALREEARRKQAAR